MEDNGKRRWSIIFKSNKECEELEEARYCFKEIIYNNREHKTNYFLQRIQNTKNEFSIIVEATTKQEAEQLFLSKCEKYNRFTMIGSPTLLEYCFAKEVELVKGKIMILGTHITRGSIDAGFYYMNVKGNNKFWKLLDDALKTKVFENLEKQYNDLFKAKKDKDAPELIQLRETIKKELNNKNIGLSDVLGFCECADTNNNSIVNPKPNEELRKMLGETECIVFNGKGIYDCYFKKMYPNYCRTTKHVTSSSDVARNPKGMTKSEEWEIVFKEIQHLLK